MTDSPDTRRSRRGRDRAGSDGSNLSGREIRSGRDLREVVASVKPGDVVVLEHLDLEPEVARALIAAGAYAVVNASPSLSGRYPTSGPLLLVRAGIVVIDDAGRGVHGLRDGERVQVDGARLRRGDSVLAEGRRRTETDLVEELDRVRAEGGAQFRTEAFVADSLTLLRESPDLADGAAADPALVRIIDGRPAVVIGSPWPQEHTDLVRRAAAAPGWAVVAAGERCASELRDAGVATDVVISPPSRPVRVGAEHTGPPQVAAVIDGQELDGAVLSVLLSGSPTVVPLGRVSEELSVVLDQPRGAAAVTGLSRLVGAGRIVDAEALAALKPAALAGVRSTRKRSDQARRQRFAGLALAALVGAIVGALIGYGPIRSLIADGGAADRAAAAAAQQQADRDRQALADAQSVVSSARSQLVQGALTNRRVVLVNGPGVAPTVTDALKATLDDAGATLSGSVTLTAKYLDPNAATSQDDVALRLAPPEATLPSGQAGDRRDAALAASVLATSADESDAAAGLLEAMSQVGAVVIEGDPQARAQVALMVIPAGDADLSALRGMAAALGSAGGVLVTTPGLVDDSSTMSALVGAPPARVSVAAGAAAPAGQVAAIEGLADAVARRFGRYGIGAVAPTAAATAGPTAPAATATAPSVPPAP